MLQHAGQLAAPALRAPGKHLFAKSQLARSTRTIGFISTVSFLTNGFPEWVANKTGRSLSAPTMNWDQARCLSKKKIKKI